VDRPGIAVLPFCDLSNDPDQQYFADGVTEDLTAVLARSPRPAGCASMPTGGSTGPQPWLQKR
jgi:hypothetical protein